MKNINNNKINNFDKLDNETLKALGIDLDNPPVSSIEDIRLTYKTLLKDDTPNNILNFFGTIYNYSFYVPVKGKMNKSNIKPGHVIKDSFRLLADDDSFCVGLYTNLKQAKEFGPKDAEYYKVVFQDYIKELRKILTPEDKFDGLFIDPLSEDEIYISSENVKLFDEIDYSNYKCFGPEL